jgi:hypothetical protein
VLTDRTFKAHISQPLNIYLCKAHLTVSLHVAEFIIFNRVYSDRVDWLSWWCIDLLSGKAPTFVFRKLQSRYKLDAIIQILIRVKS